MRDNVLDGVVEDMLSIPSLVHKIIRRKLLKVTASIRDDISPPLFLIMKVLDEASKLHIAEIGERLQIPRPQMTHLIDKLVKMEIVSRQTDTADRRIINISLTRNGKKVLDEFQRTVQSSVKIDLSCLTDEEVRELSVSMRKLRDILSKLP